MLRIAQQIGMIPPQPWSEHSRDGQHDANAQGKRIVCLANSRKYGGRCVAGKTVLPDGRLGDWVRPVSSREYGTIEAERRLSDGREPSLLDVLEVPVTRACPTSYQSENWLLDPKRPWRCTGSLKWTDVLQGVDDPETIWGTGRSSIGGLNDRVGQSEATGLANSLYLLLVDDLRLFVEPPRTKPSLRAVFSQRGAHYALRVTDPRAELRYFWESETQISVGQCLLTVSLGEPLNSFCYKLVAGVLLPDSSQP